MLSAADLVDYHPQGPPWQRQDTWSGGPRRLVGRAFSAPQPDLLWLTDITEHATIEGKLYCCAFKDVFSNRIVGYALDERMTADPRPDRGSQFRSRAFRAVLGAAGHRGSMGRVAAAGDNAAMESFFNLLQTNVLDRHRWHTRDELRHAVIHWIEHTYNRRRRQRGLGKLTPVEYELAFTPQAGADTEIDAA